MDIVPAIRVTAANLTGKVAGQTVRQEAVVQTLRQTVPASGARLTDQTTTRRIAAVMMTFACAMTIPIAWVGRVYAKSVNWITQARRAMERTTVIPIQPMVVVPALGAVVVEIIFASVKISRVRER